MIDLIRTSKLKDCIGGLENYAQGMGTVFTSRVFLIVSAEVFTAGLMKSGGIATIIQSVTAMDSGAVAVFTVMFLIVVGSAFVTGSSNAAMGVKCESCHVARDKTAPVRKPACLKCRQS